MSTRSSSYLFPHAEPTNNGKPAITSERTPLLAALVNNSLQNGYSASAGQSFVGADDATEIFGENQDDLSSILSKVNSNIPLGIEAEAIPALSTHPTEDGDMRLVKDDDLRLSTVEEDSEQVSQYSFRGGISKKQFWLIFAGILIANFVAAFDSTIMASTHTSITSAFESSNSASWLSTSFLLTSTSFQPLYGRVSDTVGRKIPFVFACFVFTISTVWCALAQSIGSFIAARAVCGVGAGGMLTMGIFAFVAQGFILRASVIGWQQNHQRQIGAIVLSDMLPIEIRGNYQSINNLAYGAGSALGAALGGFLADALGWRWEFGIQVPFGIFCMVVCAFTIPSSKGIGQKIETQFWERLRGFDIAGSFYLTTSVAFLILGMNLGGNIYPWSSPIVIGSLVLAFILGNLLIRTEKRVQSPVMPLHLVWSVPRGKLIFNNFFSAAAISTILFNIPLYFQTVLLESATVAGSRLLVPSLAGTSASVATGLIITRTGRLDPTLYFGNIITIVGTMSLTLMDRNMPDWAFLLFLIPSNLGLGFTFPSTLMSVLATSSQSDQAVATSTLIMWRSLGNVMGVASSSLIVQNFLLYFLEQRVTGPGKEDIILKVRKSVTAIYNLPPHFQKQVISSYVTSLRLCFAWSMLVAFVAFWLIAGINLPKLRTREAEGVTSGQVKDALCQKIDEDEPVV